MKTLRVLLIIFLVACVPASFAVYNGVMNSKYETAEGLYKTRNYELAAASFDELGGFRDSARRAENARKNKTYDEAAALLGSATAENGGYDAAIAAFESIAGYRDSAEQAAAARKNKTYEGAAALLASATLENGGYDDAEYEFNSLAGFRDSGEQADAARKLKAYDTAELLSAEKEYQGALDAYAAAGGIRDAAEKIEELDTYLIPYREAELLFNAGDYEAASAAFKKLAGYNDSLNRSAEARNLKDYGDAEEALLSGKYIASIELFTALGDFRDSKSRIVQADEAFWKYTTGKGTADAYGEYLGVSNAAHAGEAKQEYSRLFALERQAEAASGFENALAAGTIRALNAYINEYGGSEYADADNEAAALLRIEELKTDKSLSSPIIKASNDATSEMINDFLRDYPGHTDEEKIKSLITGDFISFMESGAITLAITGDSINQTSVSLTNGAKRDLKVTIPIGTYFAPGSSGVQNMVVREPVTVNINAGSTVGVTVKTACMNIHRSIPESSDKFSARALTGSSKYTKLARVVELCYERNASYAVTQAAVWIVTDNPGDYSLLSTLIYSNGQSAISEEDLEKAKEIVKNLTR